jgi:carboxymethylenebutenolidase
MATPQRTPAQVEGLIQEYRSGGLSRREFFQKLAFATGSILLAQQIMIDEGFAADWEAYEWADQAPQPGQQPQQPQPTPGESIAAGEKRLPDEVKAEWVKFKSGEFEIGGYLARPKKAGTLPGIIIIHENRGLTEFVLDMAQRWAGEGLVAVAVDFLSRAGGTQKFESMQAAGEGIRRLDRDGVMADLHAAVAYLKSRSDVRKDQIGVTGFCWGGGNTFRFATESKEIAFAMPFYGGAPPVDSLVNVQCPIFGVFGEKDTRINASLPAAEAKLKELGKEFTFKIYPGADHAFMNFTNPGRYHAEQARIAWADVTAFVKKVIGG